MKRLVILLIIPFLFFCGCASSVRTGILDSKNPSLDQDAGLSQISVLEGWIMDISGTSMLLCSNSASSELFLVSTKDIPLTDSSGDSISEAQLSVSDTVEISYSGGIMETYPAMFSGIIGIRLTGSENTLVPFYLEVIDDLMNNTAVYLNNRSLMLALDLSQTFNLSGAEKSALIYLAEGIYGMETFGVTYNDLRDLGYLSEDGAVFEDGLLITIAVSETGIDNGFGFSVSKWRSSKEAAGFSECIAKKQSGSWVYEPGGAWTS